VERAEEIGERRGKREEGEAKGKRGKWEASIQWREQRRAEGEEGKGSYPFWYQR
jgi:hypothetical protein